MRPVPRPRRILLALSLALLMAGSALLAQTSIAQEGDQGAQGGEVALEADTGIKATDATGDVTLIVPGSRANEPTETPAPAPSPIPSHVDLTEVRLDRVSPTEVWVGFTVDDFRRPNTRSIASATYSVCFQWSGTGDTYRLVVDMFYPSYAASPVDQEPKLKTALFDRQGAACDHWAGIGPDSHVARMATSKIQPFLDLDAGTFDVRLLRTEFAAMVTADGAAAGDVYPSKGDTLGPIVGHASAAQGQRQHYYDTVVGTETMELASNTGNSVFRLEIPASRQVAVGLESFGIPVYGVETGSFQTVPLELENHLDAPFHARLGITPISGLTEAWDVRLIPSIQVDPAGDGTEDGEVVRVPGTTSVTIIARAADDTKHKDKARFLVTATDPDHEGVLGATFVDLVAVEPVLEDRTQVYLHTTGQACRSNARWLNTIPQDPFTDGATRIEFQSCAAAQGAGLGDVGLGGGSLTFRPDVPMRRHITLDVADTINGNIAIDSVLRVPGSEEEAPFAGVVDVTVQLLAGPSLIGEGSATDVTVPGSTPIQVDIHPLTLGKRVREIRDDDGLAFRIIVSPQDRTFDVCNPQCPEGTETEVHVPAPSGRIFLDTTGTSFDLPVISTERAGAGFQCECENGDVITARLADVEALDRRFANPGGTVVFNTTIRNEGINPDVAVVSVKLNQTGWGAQILPRTEYRLSVGEATNVLLQLTAPIDAFETQTVGAQLLVASRNDPGSVSSIPFQVTVTKGQILEDDVVDDEILEALTEVEGSPAPFLGSVALILALVGVAARKRRDS